MFWIAILGEAVILLIGAEKHIPGKVFGIEFLIDVIALGVLL